MYFDSKIFKELMKDITILVDQAMRRWTNHVKKLIFLQKLFYRLWQ